MSATRAFPAPGKLNLFLHVTGRRDDGYHELQTLFQLIDYGDTLSFTPREDRTVRRVTDLAGIAHDDDLTVRAARALIGDRPPPFGVDIAIEKRLPAGGGLGGGSSDAATTLVALNELWGLGFGVDELSRIGLALGADVPVFVHGHTAFAEGIGERLTPVEYDCPWYLVIHPGCAVSTAEVFNHPELTRHTPPIRILGFSYATTGNDCEPVARRLYGRVAEALDWLGARSGCARLTGTGACIFAPFTTEAEARAIGSELPTQWQGFVARGVNRSPLLDALR
mgnify:CR=1 FL=1